MGQVEIQGPRWKVPMTVLRELRAHRYAMDSTLARRWWMTTEGLTAKGQIRSLVSPDALKRDHWLSTFEGNISTHLQCQPTVRRHNRPSPLTTDCHMAGTCDLEQPAEFIRLRPMLPLTFQTGS